MKSRKATQGFTLVEILVVIAIIALLSAILYSAFFVARKRSSDTVCISHLRQIGMALRMYAQDFDDYPDYNAFFPRGLEQIYPVYLTDFSLLKCPNVPEDIGPGVDRTNYGYVYKLKPLQPPKGEKPGPHLLTWEEAYHLRGESLPLVSDHYHGLDLKDTPDEKNTPAGRELIHVALVLRMDGSVSKSIKGMTRDEKGRLHISWYDY